MQGLRDVTATVLRGDARHLPLPDNSVDLICTSPPYFGLRSYQDGGVHYAGQVGGEATPAEFVDALIACTREWVRVLKPSGNLWVNLGDKYASGGRGTYDLDPGRREVATMRAQDGARPKSLLGIPWRYALRCIDDLGLILRAEVIWSKPNGLPESVTDRVRRSHEQWFHFTLSPRYYSAVDEVREGYAPGTQARYDAGYKPEKRLLAGIVSTARDRSLLDGDTGPAATNPLGKLPGSVWTVCTEPLRVPASLGVDHFAAFPTEFPRRIISGWSPPGVCSGCGEGRRPVAERAALGKASTTARGGGNSRENGMPDFSHINRSEWRENVTYDITGYACACPDTSAPTTPARVLDPFGGTGTTALVASVLGRHGVTVDMSADYCRLARWRTTDPGERARALRVDKPPPVIDGQGDLFAEVVA